MGENDSYDTGAFKHGDTKKNWTGGRTEIPPAPAEPRHGKSKKDTKRWCRGVTGREHKWVWVYSELFWGWLMQRRKGMPFVELPLPADSSQDNDWHQKAESGPGHVFRPVPMALMYCPVCKKQHKHTNSFTLRRKGIVILTQIPESEVN